MRLTACHIVLFSVTVAASGARAGAASNPLAAPPFDRPVVSYWCGPPPEITSATAYRQIRDAGFTLCFPPCANMTPAQNLALLDAAAANGLRAFINDRRLVPPHLDTPEGLAAMVAAVSDYANHPALAGYHLRDEPNAAEFAGLARLIGWLREHDPNRLAFVNLLPNYGTPEQLGTATYDKYLERFLTETRSPILSFDHYHFTVDGDRAGFFNNFAAVRETSLRHGVPLWAILQVTRHLNMREMKGPEFLWLANHALAYGSRGLLWFTYWPPDKSQGDFGEAGVVLADGTPSEHHTPIAKANRVFYSFGNALWNAKSEGVYFTGTLPEESCQPLPADAAVQIDSGTFTVGLFSESDTRAYALVVNRDYVHSVTASVAFPGGKTGLREITPEPKRVLDLPVVDHNGRPCFNLIFPPGDGRLFILDRPPLPVGLSNQPIDTPPTVEGKSAP